MATEELENGKRGNGAVLKGKSSRSLGQHYPSQNPQGKTAPASPLGQPLTIDQVAALLGCSAWTVRNALVPKGLPYFRSGPSGRLVFFTNQVVRWIQQQQKGGQRL